MDAAQALRTTPNGQLLDDIFGQEPARGRKNDISDDNARKERSLIENAPVPAETAGESLSLQQAEKFIQLEVAVMRKTVRRGQAGNHLTPKPLRAQNDTIVLYRNHQVAHTDLAIPRRAGRGEKGELVGAQDRPVEDVSDAPLGKVSHLGKNDVVEGSGLLFSPQMFSHAVGKSIIGVAKPSQQVGSGRPGNAVQMERPVHLSAVHQRT